MIFKLDPCDKHRDKKWNFVMAIIGSVPEWFITEEDKHGVLPKAIDIINKNYPFGFHPMNGITINEDGVFSYPDDPYIYPIVKFNWGDETIYQYEFGWVAIVDSNGNSKTARLD